VRDSIRSVVNTTIVAGDIKGKDFTSNSPVLKVLNGTGAIIKEAQVDIDKDAFGHLLLTSPVSDSLSIAISKNPIVRDSIRSVVNTTITSGALQGKDMTSNSAAIKVLNGTGATIKAIQVNLDEKELGHLLTSSPLADSLNIAISNSTVVQDMMATKVYKLIAFASSNNQKRFVTPNVITDIKKIQVYRNGINVEFTQVDDTHIDLEAQAACYVDDEIKIIQLK